MQHERLGRNDAKVVIHRGLFLRELAALAEGSSLAEWAAPERPLRPPPGTRFV